MKLSKVSNLILLPRLLRLRDAPTYLGMNRNRFNTEVRPSLTEIPIGEQGIAFDRFELDVWIDEYKSAHGCQASSKGVISWQGRNTRSRQTLRSLAHRQTYQRQARLPKHWIKSTRRSRTLPRVID